VLVDAVVAGISPGRDAGFVHDIARSARGVVGEDGVVSGGIVDACQLAHGVVGVVDDIAGRDFVGGDLAESVVGVEVGCSVGEDRFIEIATACEEAEARVSVAVGDRNLGCPEIAGDSDVVVLGVVGCGLALGVGFIGSAVRLLMPTNYPHSLRLYRFISVWRICRCPGNVLDIVILFAGILSWTETTVARS